ncbi:hypothetical protein HanRHA438_Chr15g0694991 [Helianthus annuus]|nr:hypothetical protein HanRHA438_Chr15g0694991 [Helianthus annuus]
MDYGLMVIILFVVSLYITGHLLVRVWGMGRLGTKAQVIILDGFWFRCGHLGGSFSPGVGRA